MRTKLFILSFLLISCSGVNSDQEIPSSKNEPGIITLSIPETIQTDSTYSFSLEIIEPDTFDVITITEQINSNSSDSLTFQSVTTHLDTVLTRTFNLTGGYEIIISVTDRHPIPETIEENYTADVVELTEMRTLSLVLSNSVLDTPPDEVHVRVKNSEGEQVAEGETENGRFEFETESSEGRTETFQINFTGHGFIDFTDEISHSSSAEFDFTIDPVPVEIQPGFPVLSPGDEVTFDVRDYIISVDPDDDEPVSVEMAEFTGPDNNLRIEERDEFIYEAWLDGNTAESELKAELTVYTLTNKETETVEFPVEGGVAPTELIIMPLGNSLTNDGRSRAPIWNLLVEDGHEVDFVGDQYQQGIIPDPDHEGVGGITIQEVIDKAESLMRRHDPGYVNLMIGTNDIVWYTDEQVEDIAARWNRLVQILLDSSSSETYIIAATIPPVTPRETGSNGRDRAILVQQYNERLRNYVEERQDAGDLIVLADVEAELNVNDHVASDGVHLNDEGYRIMGTVYYEAIADILRKNQ
ncbi:MAG: GDSL-type esterase/lipase family protein [Balneolaceae bacterium]